MTSRRDLRRGLPTKIRMARHIRDLREYVHRLEDELDQLIEENDALRKAH